MDADAERQDAEERIRLFPGCEGVRVVGAAADWRAVLPAVTGDEEDDLLARRPTLSLLVDFFERHGGFAREGVE